MAKIANENDYIANAIDIYRRRVATQVGSNLEAIDDFLEFLRGWGLLIRSQEHLDRQLEEARHGNA